MLNKTQEAARQLIQADARFLYTLVDMQRNAKDIRSNYMVMSQPYIGLFADGAEQWCHKLGLDAPRFNDVEKEYYSALRQSHKIFAKSYDDFMSALTNKFDASDEHFFAIRGLHEILFGYDNVGVDLCGQEFCGNTILCALYTPVNTLDDNDVGPWIRNISVVSGKLAAFFECTHYPPYEYNKTLKVKYKDYHFYQNCPIKVKTSFGFLLFSILCSINFVIQFIDKVFVEEIPQKFKFAYLQYYYLCDFIKELNMANDTHFHIDESLINREFRNCLAHYGLGQYLSEDEVRPDDVLKGLTNKAFSMDYAEAKATLYEYLRDLVGQIKSEIL